jgi:hypothetical protein
MSRRNACRGTWPAMNSFPLPHVGAATKIDLDAYRDELALVEIALVQAAELVPEAFEMRPSFVIDKAPVPPIRGKDAGRTSVAVLQHLAWAIEDRWSETPSPNKGRFFVLYPMASRLLRRKLKPDAPLATDLIRLIVMPPRSQPRHDFLPLLLRILETNFRPPVPTPLRAPLGTLLNHLEGYGKGVIDLRASARIKALLANE